MKLYVSEIQQVTQYKRLAVVSDGDTGEVVGSITYGDSVSDGWVHLMAPSLVKPKKKIKRR